jgi:predicted dehydrogenase
MIRSVLFVLVTVLLDTVGFGLIGAAFGGGFIVGPALGGLLGALRHAGLRMHVRRGNVLEELSLPVRDHFAAEMDHLSECVMEARDPLTPGKEGLRDLELMTAIDEAARSGETLRV